MSEYANHKNNNKNINKNEKNNKNYIKYILVITTSVCMLECVCACVSKSQNITNKGRKDNRKSPYKNKELKLHRADAGRKGNNRKREGKGHCRNKPAKPPPPPHTHYQLSCLLVPVSCYKSFKHQTRKKKTFSNKLIM